MRRIQLERDCVEKAQVWFSFISGILIILLSITGCSDVPYTGPVLSVDHVDRYLASTGEDTICLQDGFDSICLKQLSGDEAGDLSSGAPVVYVHPTNITYMFYYKDIPILRVEREIDTTDIVQELIDAGRVQTPLNADARGTQDNADEDWVIQIYYLASFPVANRGRTLETSGLDIRVVEGMEIKRNRQKDLEIKAFTQLGGRRGVEFSVETAASEITIQVDGLVDAHTATFHISTDDIADGDGTNIFALQPK